MSAIKKFEVKGVTFRFWRLRARRGFRGVSSLTSILGPGTAVIMGGGEHNGVTIELMTEAGGMTALGRLVARSAWETGAIHDPDKCEAFANEILRRDDKVGLEMKDPDGPNWHAITTIADLDDWDMFDEWTVLDILRHVVPWQFFPTSAGSTTNPDTDPADATSLEAKSQSGASGGAPPPRTSPTTGAAIY